MESFCVSQVIFFSSFLLKTLWGSAEILAKSEILFKQNCLTILVRILKFNPLQSKMILTLFYLFFGTPSLGQICAISFHLFFPSSSRFHRHKIAFFVSSVLVSGPFKKKNQQKDRFGTKWHWWWFSVCIWCVHRVTLIDEWRRQLLRFLRPREGQTKPKDRLCPEWNLTNWLRWLKIIFRR